MARTSRIHALLFSALVLCLVSWAVGHLQAGPLSGPRQSETPTDQAQTPEQFGTEGQETGAAGINQNATRDSVSSYLEALRSQVLPDITQPSFDDSGSVNLDGLQGWSLDDIKAAMDASALGLDDTPTVQFTSENQPSQITVSVEDLYNFNTGYYFVVEGDGEGSQGDLVSGPNLPEIIGQTALSEIELDIVSLSETGMNLGIETGVGMLDDSFFTSTNTSSSNQTIGGRGFRVGGGLGGSGGGGGGRSDADGQGTTFANFVSQTIQFIRDNAITIALLVLGFTGVGYVMSRFA